MRACVCVCVCMCVCVHGCQREKGINAEGGWSLVHQALQVSMYFYLSCGHCQVATEGVLLIFITSAGPSLWCIVYYSAWGVILTLHITGRN